MAVLICEPKKKCRHEFTHVDIFAPNSFNFDGIYCDTLFKGITAKKKVTSAASLIQDIDKNTLKRALSFATPFVQGVLKIDFVESFSCSGFFKQCLLHIRILDENQ